MGKGGQDKLFVTASEHSASGGYRDKSAEAIKRLPFHYCALSFVQVTNPVAAPDGFVFDLVRIVPWLRANGTHPCTGAKLSGKDLLRLKLHRDADGALICPVTMKALTEHTKVAAVRTTGHVYSYDALQSLCLGPKNMRDLLEDAPFTREDVLILQDPANAEWVAAHTTTGFFHVKNPGGSGKPAGAGAGAGAAGARAAAGPSSAPALADGTVAAGGGLIRTTAASRAIYEEMARVEGVAAGKKRAREEAEAEAGAGAGKRRAGEATPAEAELYERVRAVGRPAFVTLVTTHGPLNLRLEAAAVPRTCHNFLLLCSSGAYDGTRFHRLIPGFMVQAGDFDGEGGVSAWGAGVPLLDEPCTRLKHSGRGVLSMANSGPNTARSQFFLTFAAAGHLDGKHCAFGKLVGGGGTLDAIEAVPSDAQADNVPTQDVRILSVSIVQDPFQEAAAAAAIPKPGPVAAGAGVLLEDGW
jgi:peptidyl-prolyl cis-trans isomerase-like protein 2